MINDLSVALIRHESAGSFAEALAAFNSFDRCPERLTQKNNYWRLNASRN